MSRTGLTIAGWGLTATGLILILIGAFSDLTVQIPSSYSVYGGFTEASRTVNYHKMFNALGCIIIGGFGFVSGSIFLAAASLRRDVVVVPEVAPHQSQQQAASEKNDDPA